ncbi:DUF2000 family protein [Burkholderia sp. D-99]|uniref:DUF2000 family protein n=1 Tax=Burkholderia sp. D-99 TaxID=2717316 RepID=UPI001AA0D335
MTTIEADLATSILRSARSPPRQSATGHDAANRDVFRTGDAENPDLVGPAMHGPKKTVEKAAKELALHT